VLAGAPGVQTQKTRPTSVGTPIRYQLVPTPNSCDSAGRVPRSTDTKEMGASQRNSCGASVA
jgi:hypothetical protein